jgi:hypothetical protein
MWLGHFIEWECTGLHWCWWYSRNGDTNGTASRNTEILIEANKQKRLTLILESKNYDNEKYTYLVFGTHKTRWVFKIRRD